MTKYILHGGYLRKASDAQNTSFFKEITKDFEDAKLIKILYCMFAEPVDAWEVKFKGEKEIFSRYLKNFTFELADPDGFIEQIKISDVIYFRGGREDKLIGILNKHPTWIKEIKNKIVVGSSAGADMLARYFWSCDLRINMDGMGILPIKFLPHYKSDYGVDDSRGPIDWDIAYQELKKYKEELPIYALKEGEYVIIKQ